MFGEFLSSVVSAAVESVFVAEDEDGGFVWATPFDVGEGGVDEREDRFDDGCGVGGFGILDSGVVVVLFGGVDGEEDAES